MLELRDVHFGYEQEVLHGITLDLRPGEVLALLGPNGAGKSTILGLAQGLLRPSRGEVLLDGRPLRHFSQREIAHRVALVAQSGELRFPLTALEYVLAGRFAHGSAFGFDSPHDVEIAHQALVKTDAAQFARRPFNQLSSGERQRVALARALAQEAPLLLLDEPTANADIAHQISLLAFVRRLTRERGFGSLVVTHEINLASEFADRVALLQNGALIACGPPRDVLTAPLLGEIFNLPLLVDAHPQTGNPRISWAPPT